MTKLFLFQLNKTAKQVLDSKEHAVSRPPVQGNDLTSDQLMAGFEARQASPGYQEMLVCIHVLSHH